MVRLAAGDANGLRDYQGRRLELADIIRAALHVARGYADEETQARARGLLTRLAEDRFQLAVAGQFSRGKSTLMNALLGAAYLPMGALPMTSVVTTVRYGSRPRAIVRRRGSTLPVEAPLAEMARFVAQGSAERTELQVASVEVELPAELLRLGFEFADTPGIGSAIEVNTAMTKQFLPQADAVIFVTGFDSPLTAAETGFLADAARHAGKLFVVINKRDLVSDRDAAEVAGYVRRWLRDELNLREPRIFALSALDALEATIQADSERLANSGILPLQDILTEFLTAGKAGLLLRNVAVRAARLVASQRRDLRLGRLAADGGPDPRTVEADFDARIGELAARQRAVAEKITGRVAGGLPGLLAARSPAWQASLRQILGPYAENAVPGETEGSARDLLGVARGRLEQAGQQITRRWLDRRAAEVQEILTGMVAGEIGELLGLSRSPGVLGAEIAGLALAEDRDSLAGWSAEDLPDLWVPQAAWSVPLRPRSGRRRAAADARQVLTGALAAAITAFESRAREGFQDVARDWAERLSSQAARQAREEADRFRHCLRTPPREEDLAALRDLAARLDSFQAALSTWDPVPSGSRAATGPAQIRSGEPRTTGTVTCEVCEQMEAALTEHLRHGQFRLATREHDQKHHARTGGYCPLHTWQYAAIASPLGISAGYAKLAASVAEALDTISQRSSAAAELAREVADLTPHVPTCAVCAALAEREGSAITRLATTPEAGAAALCLRHLALALAACRSPSEGQPMLHALAATLRRYSDDMRTYALKREALHSGLVTEEEAQAHLGTLRLLASHPALAQPWGFPARE